MHENLVKTVKAWPVIAAVTISLCFATQWVAGLFGIDLPDQQNVDTVREWMLHAFDSPRNFTTCAILLVQVLLLLPMLEELVFRWLLFMLPGRLAAKRRGQRTLRPATAAFALAAVSSALFSAAHYIAQPFPDSAFFALFFFGLAQCWLYARTDRIWCPMLNHALFNLTNVVLMLVLPK
ncbi:MAG: CPBP family intramembrane metalloprotease [Kiritimatiellae bacterium]|nr:CPBP family intramembrane metalloprotease [Kiritimatiellia bacterium]